MKRSVLLIIVILSMLNLAFASEQSGILGQWNGVLNVQGMNMRLVFHIEKTENDYTSTMDSPDQGAFGIPVGKTTFEDSKLTLEIPNIGLFFEGELGESSKIGRAHV